MTLTVLCGMPGAGKSTYASRLTGVVVLSADAYRTDRATTSGDAVFPELNRSIQVSLNLHRNVVVDTCALYAGSRMRYRLMAKEAHTTCELVVFTTPWWVCQTRDEARARAQRAQPKWLHYREAMAAAMGHIYTEPWDRITWVPGPSTAARVCWGTPER